MLQAKEINKKFRHQNVLQQASLEINSEIKALIGINGSGKSTFLKIIAGIITADSGKVFLNGCDVTSMPPERRNVGYVPQRPALFQHMTVKENILYGMHNGKGSIETYERVIDLLDLQAVLDKHPMELSGGYQTRTSLARALVPQPQILLMDEPLTGIDVVLKERILPNFRKALKELQVPVLYVTHDPKEAELLADNYAIMHNGQVRQVDTAAEAFELIHFSILKEQE
ncbi:ABC-type sugar transport systems, ATPase component (plasmid) [Peptoclostridium acidaminophilum DSM 3953]|uniref:ABC-type sugar transport systems, ATPase component n=1 Tax=Peptoclostridium acidaminophilum DSM 3953 TaxID=1286171 RepID=W8TNL1_PEPAC|nr:ABC transporter ATP-binding protein [Peptoclostridium acidaminophilum]AHM57752.1 ABC-type sugar transport systems, ATPase component [Peptoclostridium acidaminophilum DSM 3953]